MSYPDKSLENYIVAFIEKKNRNKLKQRKMLMFAFLALTQEYKLTELKKEDIDSVDIQIYNFKRVYRALDDVMGF